MVLGNDFIFIFMMEIIGMSFSKFEKSSRGETCDIRLTTKIGQNIIYIVLEWKQM
jgi:hypothetical protein